MIMTMLIIGPVAHVVVLRVVVVVVIVGGGSVTIHHYSTKLDHLTIVDGVIVCYCVLLLYFFKF